MSEFVSEKEDNEYKFIQWKEDVLTVAVDVDEVLAQFMNALISFHNDRYKTKLQISDFISYAFNLVWGGTYEETTDKMNKFFESDYFKDISPIPKAKDVLLEFSDKFNFVIVTSRQHFLKKPTKKWLQMYFPGIFCDIKLGNLWGSTGKKIPKPEICKEIGAVALIDDSFSYCKQCSEIPGFKSFLFNWKNMYKWNDLSDFEKYSGSIIKGSDWDDVKQFLENLKVSGNE